MYRLVFILSFFISSMTKAYELPVEHSVGSTYSDGWGESVYPGESYNLKNRIVRDSKNYSSKKSMLTSFTVELIPINLGRDDSIRTDLYINNELQDSVDVVGQGIYTSGDFVSYKFFSKVPAVGKWRVRLSFEGKTFYKRPSLRFIKVSVSFING